MKKYTKPEIKVTEVSSVSIITLSGLDKAQSGTDIKSVSKASFGNLKNF